MPSPGRPDASPLQPTRDVASADWLAARAASLLHLLRVLRSARDEGTITAEQYEAAVEAIASDPEQPPEQ